MKLKKSATTTSLDAAMEGYVAWRQESRAVAASYRDWNCAARDERGRVSDAYFAALDREELAAAAYQRLVERVVG